jgi:hypothetical protein
MQEKMDFLREDLTHLFDDQGIDQSAYDDVVEFIDPITKYGSAKGDAVLSLSLSLSLTLSLSLPPSPLPSPCIAPTPFHKTNLHWRITCPAGSAKTSLSDYRYYYG